MTDSKQTAVIFGAGNIGRGFLAQLVHESGMEIIFVDVVPHVLALLAENSTYQIHIVGDVPDNYTISNYRVINGSDRDAVADSIISTSIVFTAVGAAALPHIAPTLAAGIKLRSRQSEVPLNIIICENLVNVGEKLRDLVAEYLSDDQLNECVGFVPAVVSRMAPLQTPEEAKSLDIRVEAYHRLPIDARAVVGELPDIVGVQVANDFAFQVARKLYIHNCGHAVLGYLGWRAGIEFGWQALEDEEISEILSEAWAESGEALLKKFGANQVEHERHIADLRHRFANRGLGDTCFRLARDPIRKIAPGDRLVGAARLCEEMNIQPKAIAKAIASAYRFAAPEDPFALQLRTSVTQIGIDMAIEQYSGISVTEPLGLLVKAEYERLAGRIW